MRRDPRGRFAREAAAERFGVDVRSILVELGARRMVGGQEDMIVDVALGLVRCREAGSAARVRNGSL
jgi:4-hydroxy 2-oxovalerate aldolase